MRYRSGFRRGVATLLIPLTIAGCWSWRPSGVSPETIATADLPDSARVTLRDSTRHVMSHPRVEDGRLIARNDTVGVALADVTRIEAFALNRTATGILLVAAMVAVLVSIRGLESLSDALSF